MKAYKVLTKVDGRLFSGCHWPGYISECLERETLPDYTIEYFKDKIIKAPKGTWLFVFEYLHAARDWCEPGREIWEVEVPVIREERSIKTHWLDEERIIPWGTRYCKQLQLIKKVT